MGYTLVQINSFCRYFTDEFFLPPCADIMDSWGLLIAQ